MYRKSHLQTRDYNISLLHLKATCNKIFQIDLMKTINCTIYGMNTTYYNFYKNQMPPFL